MTDRPTTEPRPPVENEWDALDRALLMCYGKPQGTNATAILRWLAQDGYTVVRAEAAQGAAPRAEGLDGRALLDAAWWYDLGERIDIIWKWMPEDMKPAVQSVAESVFNDVAYRASFSRPSDERDPESEEAR